MRNLLHAAVILSAIACTNDVAVTNGPSSSTAGPEELRLESALITHCRTICEHLSACPGTGSQTCSCGAGSRPGTPAGEASAGTANGNPDPSIQDVSSDCVCQTEAADFGVCLKDCVDDVSSTFLNGGEPCAKAGASALGCFAGLSCAELSVRSENSCGFKSAAALCPSASSDHSTPDQVDSSQGAQGGSAAVDGRVAAVGGAAANNVTCQTGEIAAPVFHGQVSANQQLCDVSSTDCSDGHTYRQFCGTNNELRVNCFCVFDGRTQVMFENPALLTSSAPTSDCQDTKLWNSRCGWSLMESSTVSDASL